MPERRTRNTPTVWVAPVRSHCRPNTSSLSCAPALPVMRATVLAAIAAMRQFELLDIALSPLGCSCCSNSIREWPGTEVVADVAPQPVETLRLDHQKENDEAAENDQPGAGNDAGKLAGAKKHASQRLHDPADRDWQHRHENSPEYGAEHRAEPADDDHGEIIYRHADLERLVVGVAEVGGGEHPAHP